MKYIFLFYYIYIYSIWAIFEGWGAWNAVNIIRELSHLSSLSAPNGLGCDGRGEADWKRRAGRGRLREACETTGQEWLAGIGGVGEADGDSENPMG